MNLHKKLCSLYSIFPPLVRELGLFDAIRFLIIRKNIGGEKSGLATFSPKRFQGQKIAIRPGTTDIGSFQDSLTTRFYLPLWDLPENANIVDLGGNIGTAAADFAVSYPTAKIVSVEMDDANYEQCLRNTSSFGTRVRTFHVAIWDKDETVRYEGEGEDGFHVSESSESDRSVEGITMNELTRRAEISTIDYLKIDIEGAERQLFQSSDLGWLSKVNSLCCEIHSPDLYEIISNVLTKKGFTVKKDPRHWNAIIARKPE